MQQNFLISANSFVQRAGIAPLPSSTTAPSPQTETLRPGHPERDDQSDAPFAQERRRNWARLIARTYLCDPELCLSCGHRMKVAQAISSPAQDDIIEKILRHINKWNPPWQAQRRARGPPRPTQSSAPEARRPELPESSDPLPTDEHYAVDPPVPDDFA